VEKHGSEVRLLHADVISPPQKKNLYDRLAFISEKIQILVKEFSPDEVAIEDIFLASNPKSAFHLGLARGVVLCACFGKNIGIFEYAPTQVKAVVTGHGRADKDQVKKMVEMIVGKKLDLRHDATDAIAVAICHASTTRFT